MPFGTLARALPSATVRYLALGVPLALVAAYFAADAWGDPEGGSVPLAEIFTPAAERPLAPAVLQARFASDSTAIVGTEPLLLHPAVRPFYAGRAFAPVWADAGAHDTLFAALMAVEDEGIRPGDVGADRLRARLAAGATSDSARVDIDLLLTDGYFRLADALLGRRANPTEVYSYNWFPTRRKTAPTALLRDALAGEAPGRAVATALDRLRPRQPEYAALRAALARARRDDGTPRIPEGETVTPGGSADVMPLLRRRLSRSGDWAGRPPPDSLRHVLDAGLADGLRRFQARRGLEATGALDGPTREALNTPGTAVGPLLAINLERWRWLPDTLGSRHVWVNIPAFELAFRVRDGARWREERTMRIVVGGSGRWQTPIFSDTIATVVFNPSWIIPASIQIESYGRVNPRGMWRDPGPGNPLGRVKFVFPNPHGIYLHDTTARWGFTREYRAMSHGCIRLHDPQALVEAILSDEGWDTTRVQSRFSGPWVTQNVELARPVPVHLVYFTAFPAGDGTVRFYDDVYRLDGRLAEALGYTAGELEAARRAG